MDITPKCKKVMSKDEVSLLIDLIQGNPVLTSKETNATTNKIKEETWTNLASVFNAKSGSFPRTKDQLKLKWDNLKKAARKRTQQIRMNSLKTGGGKPDFIPADEILEKVSGLLGSTCTGFAVPFGGDGVGCSSIVVLDADEVLNIGEGSDSYEADVHNDARPNVPDNVEILDKTPNKGMQERKRKILDMHNENSPIGESSKKFFGMSISAQLKTMKKGKKNTDDGRLARNLAITRYYEKKAEKIDLEIKLLRLELDQKENRNRNVNNDE